MAKKKPSVLPPRRRSTALLVGVITSGLAMSAGIAIGSGRGLTGAFDGLGYLFGGLGWVILAGVATIVALVVTVAIDRERPRLRRLGTVLMVATVVIGIAIIGAAGGGWLPALTVLAFGLPAVFLVQSTPRRRASLRSRLKAKLRSWLDDSERPANSSITEDFFGGDDDGVIDAEVVEEEPAPKAAKAASGGRPTPASMPRKTGGAA